MCSRDFAYYLAIILPAMFVRLLISKGAVGVFVICDMLTFFLVKGDSSFLSL